jgi:hypothetical protein
LAHRAAAALFAVACVAPASAAGDAAGACKVTSRSDKVVIVVCPARSDPTVWRTAGVAACADKITCNAWIWDDAASAPGRAPVEDKSMPKDAARKAKAIWVHDSEQLIQVRPAPK